MQINPKNLGPVRPETTRTTQPADVADRDGVRSVGPTPSASDRSDRVEISDAGRALSAREGDAPSSSAPLDPARADRIRQRVLSGAYDTLEVVDAVARRIIDTGE